MLCTTPLHDEYAKHGGKVVDFHGWALPVQFKGIIEEHHHTRSKVSLFDCSHMAEFMLTGEDSIRAFDALVFNDMVGLRIGRCRYSALLNEAGGIVDDLVAMRLSDNEMYVVTNAGPCDEVAGILERACGARNLTPATTKIDVQGPGSRDVMLKMGFSEAATLKYFVGCRSQWRGTEIILDRGGYTGELGYELFTPNELAAPLWNELLSIEGVEPAGLGARDTLRLEMGFTLYGQDMDATNTPLEAGLDRFIDWNSDFPGKERSKKQFDSGEYLVRTAIRAMDRRAPRHGHDVFLDGSVIGKVTSGSFGPSVGCGVGMALIPPSLAKPGVKLTVGPKGLEVETTEFPFYKDGSFRS